MPAFQACESFFHHFPAPLCGTGLSSLGPLGQYPLTTPFPALLCGTGLSSLGPLGQYPLTTPFPVPLCGTGLSSLISRKALIGKNTTLSPNLSVECAVLDRFG